MIMISNSSSLFTRLEIRFNKSIVHLRWLNIMLILPQEVTFFVGKIPYWRLILFENDRVRDLKGECGGSGCLLCPQLVQQPFKFSLRVLHSLFAPKFKLI